MGIPKEKLAVLIGKVKDKHGADDEEDASEGYSSLDCAKKILKAIKADDAQMLADALDELEGKEEDEEDVEGE